MTGWTVYRTRQWGPQLRANGYHQESESSLSTTCSLPFTAKAKLVGVTYSPRWWATTAGTTWLPVPGVQ